MARDHRAPPVRAMLSTACAIGRRSMSDLLPTCKSLPGAPIAIFAFIVLPVQDVDSLGYARGAAVLGGSLARFAANVRRYLVVLPGMPLAKPSAANPSPIATSANMKHLFDRVDGLMGWPRCSMKPLKWLGKLTNVPVRWHSTFTKLRLFGLTQFQKLLSLDTDTLAAASLQPLLDYNLDPDQHLAAVKDISWNDRSLTCRARTRCTFNTGVMLLRPSAAVHKKLLAALTNGSGITHSRYRKVRHDQDFLNIEFPFHETGRLPLADNANLLLYRHAYKAWNSTPPLRIIHYTLVKPWLRNVSHAYRGKCVPVSNLLPHMMPAAVP